MVDPGTSAGLRRPSRPGFAGFTSHLTLGVWAASGALLAAGIAWAAIRLASDELARLGAEAEAQAEAHAKAHAALAPLSAQAQAQVERTQRAEEAAGAARAELLVYAAGRGEVLPLKPGEVAGRLEDGRVWGFSTLGLAEGATLALARPDLAPLLKDAGPLVAHDGIWCSLPGSRGALGRVPRPVPAEALDLAGPLRLLGAVTVAPRPSAPLGLPWLGFLAVTVLAGLGAAAWFRVRWSGPIDAALLAARDFDHGQERARADVGRGNRDAREIAVVVNALIERAERYQAQGRAARSQDVQGAARAIATFGQGDLRGPTPALGEPFSPLAEALEQSRRDLIERVSELHDTAARAAHATLAIGPAAKKVAEAAGDQRDALHHLGEGLTRSRDEAQAAQERLSSGLAGLQKHAAEQRRVIQEARATWMAVGRRSGDLSALQRQAAELVQTSASLDQALSLLSRLVQRRGDDGVDLPPARLTAMAGEGRAAFEALGRGLASLVEELGQLGAQLEHTAQSQPELGGDPSSELTSPLLDLGSTWVRVAELTAGSLKALERAHRGMAEGAGELAAASRGAPEVLKALGPALATVRVGAGFEETLLLRLQQSLLEIQATQQAGGTLTADGVQLLEEVKIASEAARARLARMVDATENALSMLRS